MFLSMADGESMGNGQQFRVNLHLVPPLVNATSLIGA